MPDLSRHKPAPVPPRHVVFATPCYSHYTALEYTMSVALTTKIMAEKGISHEWRYRPGDQFIAKCRSALVDDFLKGEGTDLFFIDDDLGWDAEKVLPFLNHPAPILAGVYPQRMDELNWPCALEASDSGGLIERGGYVKAVGAPTGFMRIKRWVLEKLWPLGTPYNERDADGAMYARRAIFNCGPGTDQQWWGEDMEFCNVCGQQGIEIWIDPDVNFVHRGGKRWGGNMLSSMERFRERAAEVAEQARSTAA